jgi:hypothetical protein
VSADITGALWIKSTYSSGSGGNCVEVAGNLPGAVAVRDSKHPSGPVLVISPQGWAVFTSGVKSGEFGLV